MVGAALAVVSTGLLRWLGTAAVLTTAPPLVRMAWRHPWWQARRDRLPPVLLVALAVLVLGPLLAGDPPSSRDHGIHYFQIRMMVEELLPSGKLWGWSQTLNHGYPYGESYPVLGYLWMAAAHLLSFGAISLRTSYAWGLAALWMLSTGVAWWLASGIVRELGSKRATETEAESESSASAGPASAAGWAGLVAAALWMLDPGASRQGGWNYLMFHGVWPQLLAATLWAASLGLTWRAMARPTPRRLAFAMLTLGASLWSHPFAMLTAAASAGAFMMVIVLVPGARRWPGPWRSWAVIHIGGALLGAAWVTTFFTSAASMARSPVPWIPLGEIGTNVIQGTLLPTAWAWAGPLVVLGAVLIVRRGGTKGWLILGLAIVLLVLASEEAISVLRLDLVLSGFKNLQFPRYTIPLKPLWFALAGVGVAQVLTWIAARRFEPVAPPADASAWLRRSMVALLLAPLAATVVPQTGRLLARPVGSIDTLRDDGLATDEAKLLAALEREAADLPPDRPLTVAFMRAEMSGATYPIATIADAGARLALDSHIPTVNFKHRLRRKPAAYASLGVTHVIHDRPIPEEEERLAEALELVGQYGPFTLDRFTPPRDRQRRIAEMRGPGEIEIIDEQTERLELQVTDVGHRSRLIIGRAPHVRWELTFDDEVLEIEPRPTDNNGLSGMSVVLPHDGRVVLRYVVEDYERYAGWCSAVMLVLGLLAIAIGGPPLATREPSPAARRMSLVVVVAGVLVAIVVVGMRQRGKLAQSWTEFVTDSGELEHYGDDPEDFQFVRDFIVDDAMAIDQDYTKVCSGLMGKDVRAGCSEAAHAVNVSFMYRAPYLYRCLRISIPARGNVELAFPALTDEGNRVYGILLRHDRKGTGKALRWGTGQTSRGPTRNRTHEFMLEANDGRVPSLKFRNDGNAIEQVCVALSEMTPP